MNNLDDFLKSKLTNAEFNAPSGWEALNDAIPAKKTGKAFAVWAISALVVSGLLTTWYVFNKPSAKIALENNPSQTANLQTYENNPTVAELPANTSTQAVVGGNAVVAPTHSPVYQPFIPSVNPVNTASQGTKEVNSNAGEGSTKTTNTGEETKKETPATKASASSQPNEEPAKPVVTTPETNAEVSAKPDEETIKSNPSKGSKVSVRAKVKNRSDFHKGKLYAVASVSLIGSYRSFQLNDGAAPYIHKQYDDIRQNSEQSIITNGVSLGLEYRLLKNFSVQAGISYNKIGFQSSYNFEMTDKAITDNTGRIIGYQNLTTPAEIMLNSRTTLGVVRIPFGINYNLLFNSNSLFHIYLGGAQDFIVSANGTSLDQLTLQQKGISKTDFVNTAREMCVGLGVNYALSSNYGLGVDLYYNKWITNISRNKYENVTPFSGGVNVSISRKLF